MKDLGGELQKGPEQTEEVLLTIANGVDRSASTRTGGVEDDNQILIKNMWVLQVEAKDPKIIRHIVKGELVSETKNQFRVKLLDSSGGEKWNIIVAINSDESDLNTNEGKTFSTFATTGKRVDKAAVNASILMQHVTNDYTAVGVVTLNGSSDIAIGRYMSPLSVSLLRAVAKVDIGVGTYNASNNTWSNSGSNKIPFTLKTVQLRGSKLGVRWYFNIDSETFDPAANVVKKASTEKQGPETTNPQLYEGVTSNTYFTNRIYMLESAMSGSLYDENHLNRPRLIIGGSYEGGPETYYRIDFSGLNGGPKDFFTSDILRNHLYRFSINSVSGPGQPSRDDADKMERESLTFSSTIEPWTNGVEDNPQQQIGYYMNYGGLNGQVTTTAATGDILIKSPDWRGRQWDNMANKDYKILFDYNTFYGEADNYWGHWPNEDPGKWNGDLYYTANGVVDKNQQKYAALKTEGVYPTLMIASNNLVDAKGANKFPWKTGKALTAFDMCRSYSGGGFSDWRLPRLSELALMYANREALEKLSGFEPFGTDAVYWSGSEYGVGKQNKSHQAWTLKFSTTGDPFIVADKSDTHLIRCVRQP